MSCATLWLGHFSYGKLATYPQKTELSPIEIYRWGVYCGKAGVLLWISALIHKFKIQNLKFKIVAVIVPTGSLRLMAALLNSKFLAANH